jgi:hypothetical protein
VGRGKGAGTGRPLNFQCSNCRKRKGYPPNRYYDQGYINQVTLTGKTKSAFDGNAQSGRSTSTAVQYTCNFCGHTGWSRHHDIFVKAVRAGLKVHKMDESKAKRILENRP